MRNRLTINPMKIIAASVLFFTILFTTTQAFAQKPPPAFIAIYMIGSDLEDGNGVPKDGLSGTRDFDEMIKAAKAMKRANRQNVDVFVGFGGANKDGWRGIKYASLDCLIKDGKDGVYGNAHCYDYVNPKADMGKEETLEHFLKAANARKHGKMDMLLFWDHGAAFMGIGPDTNTGSILYPHLMAQALHNTNSHFNLIGFDTCLMGSLGIGNEMSPFAHYLVASEDLEPGHGWDYSELLSYLGKHPDIHARKFGTFVVDSFLDSPKHEKHKPKTLSLVDLSKIGNLKTTMDQLFGQISKDIPDYYPSLIQSAQRSETYGKQPGSFGYTVDLKDFLENINHFAPWLAGSTDKALDAMNQYVVYSRTDGTKPRASGVAIFTLLNHADYKNKNYTPYDAPTKTWFNLVKAFNQYGGNDKEKPVIEDIVPHFDGEHAGSFDVHATDNVAIMSVDSVHAIVVDEKKNIALNVEQELIPLQGDVYKMDQWDGRTMFICNGECDADNEHLIPIYYDNDTDHNTTVYMSKILVNKTPAIMYLETNDHMDVVDYWIVPFFTNDQGETMISRKELDLYEGDTIQFQAEAFNYKTHKKVTYSMPKFTLTKSPHFIYDHLAGAHMFYFAKVSDYVGNTSYTPLWDVEEEE